MRMFKALVVPFFAVLVFLGSVQAYAQERVALVIGNADYAVDPLKYAVNDAKAVKEKLEKLGFDVVYRENLRKGEVGTTLDAFRGKLKKDAIALIYYSGHSLPVFGTNYLLPAFQRKIRDLKTIPEISINLNKLITEMEAAGTALNIVLMDANRRAPLTRNIHRGTHGLARMDGSATTLISFANQPATYAGDKSKRKHSKYASALLPLLNQLDQPFALSLKKVTAKNSEFWLAGATEASFVLNPEKEYQAAVQAAVEKAKPKHGDLFKEELVDISFVYIRPGSFMMGSPETELHRYRDEELHQVEIKKGFWMGQHEVSFDQYKKFHEMTSYTKPLDNHWGEGKRPVIMINWYESCAYANWLSAMTGRHYRLPTEAEWEYAARAGTGTAFFYGDDENGFDEYAWNGENSEYKTQPIGLKKPNPWGLYDIHGNVWEWTSSIYSQEFDGSELVDASLEVGYDDRSARGGGWYFHPKGMRSADRRLYHPKQKLTFMGLRLVLEE